jgi:hypothetical protein
VFLGKNFSKILSLWIASLCMKFWTKKTQKPTIYLYCILCANISQIKTISSFLQQINKNDQTLLASTRKHQKPAGAEN